MQHIPEDYCAEFMDYLRAQVTCEWCRHPNEPVMPRVGLCSHCNRIRLQLNRIEARAEAVNRRYGGIPHRLDWDLRVQRAMVEKAKHEGRKYGRFFDEEFTDTKLEYEWRWLCERATGKDFFFGLTNSLNYSFSLNQRRYIFYLLSLMSREVMRKHRRGSAMGAVAIGNADGDSRAYPPIIGQEGR